MDLNLKDIKLIVSDLDGTLVNSSGKISEEFFDLYEKLKRFEVTFAFASGRQYQNLAKIFSSIKEEVYFIVQNGAYMLHKEKEIFSRVLSKENVTEAVKIVKTLPEREVVLCGKKSAYIQKGNVEFKNRLSKTYEILTEMENITQPIEDDILQISICDLKDVEKDTFPHFEKFKEKHLVKVSGEIWMDINPIDANKGIALHELQKILNVSEQETMAFGDYMNDTEMLQNAYYSFAVENAHPKILKTARFITLNNDEKGVETIIEKVLEQKEIEEYKKEKL